MGSGDGDEVRPRLDPVLFEARDLRSPWADDGLEMVGAEVGGEGLHALSSNCAVNLIPKKN